MKPYIPMDHTHSRACTHAHKKANESGTARWVCVGIFSHAITNKHAPLSLLLYSKSPTPRQRLAYCFTQTHTHKRTYARTLAHSLTLFFFSLSRYTYT